MRRAPSIAPAIRFGMLMSGPTLSFTARRSKALMPAPAATKTAMNTSQVCGVGIFRYVVSNGPRRGAAATATAIPARYPKIVARLRKKPVMNPSTTATKRHR